MSGNPPERRCWTAPEAALLLAALASPAWLLAAILRLGVDTPYMDQWEVEPLFAHLRAGSLSLSDLLALQNESRMVVPRLVFLALGVPTGWNLRLEMLPGFALACFNAAALYRLDRGALGGPRVGALGRLALSSFLLFGPIQYENWFWGHQVAIFIPVSCLLGTLLVARGQAGPGVKIGFAAALALVATFSFANGMLLWLLAPAALLLDPAGSTLRKRKYAALWCALAILALGVYFGGYARPENQHGMGEAPILDVPLYFLALLGSPLGQGVGWTGFEASVGFGAAAVALFAGAAALLLRLRFDAALLAGGAPFLLLGAYSLVTAAAPTAGRSGSGLAFALSPRYATNAVLLSVSLVHLLGLLLPAAAREGTLRLTPARAAGVAAALATAALFAGFLTSSRAMLRAENWRVRRLEGRACLAFLDIAPNETILRTHVYPDLEVLRERAREADRLGLLRPALVRPEALPHLLGGAADRASGSFHQASPEGDAVRCGGKALLPRRGEPADGVLVGFIGGDGLPRVLAVAQTSKIRVTIDPPTADFRRHEEWECRIPQASIPPEIRNLRAWAYDAVEGRAFPLPGAPAVPRR